MDDFDLSQYLALFLEESRENLDALNEGLLRLEREPENLGVVADLFRAAHTLKGMAATMGFEAIAALTHELEDVLDLVRSGRRTVDSALVDVLFRAVDTLGAMLDAVTREGKDDIPHADVLGELRLLREGKDPAATSSSLAEEDSSGSEFPEVPASSYPPYVQVVVREALRKGYGVYRLDVELVPDALLKSARAFLVYRTAEEYGEVLHTDPPVEDIEEERMETAFSLLVATSAPPEELRRSVANVSEVASVVISRVIAEGAQEDDASIRKDGRAPETGGSGPTSPEVSGTPQGSLPER
ncbi:MAG TPA: chemotaxis protein CheA, partial [Bacillaceae bacterium]|nr:chemotaxis protein CheA [Bacillaceae bacterium]